MAPVILELRKSAWSKTIVVSTAQHRDMVVPILSYFGINPDHELDVMRPGQDLSQLLSRILDQFDEILASIQPNLVIVQGDTTTVLGASIAAFHRKVPVVHVEAGLRTKNIYSPFPEEMNRRLVSRLATYHFAPTEQAQTSLLEEKVDRNHVHVVGNTAIDALLIASKTPRQEVVDDMILVTCHRRENHGGPISNIMSAIDTIARNNPSYEIVFPVHPNPNVSNVVRAVLGNVRNITLTDPLSYPEFVSAMRRCRFILSDSGGVQEEAPALAKPVLVLREETERPEAVDLGLNILVGANTEAIVLHAQKLIDDEAVYQAMARGISPYGDGRSSAKISEILSEVLRS